MTLGVKEQRRLVIIALIVLAIVLVMALVGYIVWENGTFGVTHYTHSLPSLAGLKILQISDLHNKEFFGGNTKLHEAIDAQHPDYIFLTGDIIEDERLDVAKELIIACTATAPTYYVTGNHEGSVDAKVYKAFIDLLQSCGVVLVDNKAIIAEYNGTPIAIVGIGDSNIYASGDKSKYVLDTARELKSQAGDCYTIALSHRPDYMAEYASAQLDFVFAGHAHGGQWRLGKIGAYSKSQGLLPKYTSGLYTQDKTTMLVNRGLGNSAKWVPRIFNRAEITVLEFVE